MKVTIDGSGRVVIPSHIRQKIGLKAGTELALEADQNSIRLTREAPAPKLVRRGKRLVVVPSVEPGSAPAIDIAAMVDEERNRWPF